MIYDCVRLKRKISREKEEDEENKTYSIINQIIFIFLQFSSCIIYLLRELKMESTVAVSIFYEEFERINPSNSYWITFAFKKYKTNRDGSDFYGACQLRLGFEKGSISYYQKTSAWNPFSVIYSFAIFHWYFLF